MALYKDKTHVKLGHGTAFDGVKGPGVHAPHAGIYRCDSCGHEIGIAEGHTLPSENHKGHIRGTPIQWQLLVYAEHNKD